MESSQKPRFVISDMGFNGRNIKCGP